MVCSQVIDLYFILIIIIIIIPIKVKLLNRFDNIIYYNVFTLI